MILTPKNWGSFQHYKDREPSWIKLHKSLLTNYEFVSLPIASKALAPMLWLLASEYTDGVIDASLDKIAFRVSMTRGDLAEALTPLIESDFFDASEPLAEPERHACLEKEDIGKRDIGKTEKKETREAALLDDWPSDYREQFWRLYPNKVGKPDALKKLDAVRKRGTTWMTLIVGLRDYIRDKPPDRAWCNPATWLHQERWGDQPATVSATNGNATINHRTDSGAGRATARETQLVTSVGGGALRFLEESRAAGPGRPIPDRPDTPREPDFDWRSKNAG